MLYDLKPLADLTKEQSKEAKRRKGVRLALLSQAVKTAKLPVIVVFEGFGAAGKGSYISELILNWDPRGFKTISTGDPEPYEKRRPWLWLYWKEIPEYGQIAVFDRSWYRAVTADRIDYDLSDERTEHMIEDIKFLRDSLQTTDI